VTLYRGTLVSFAPATSQAAVRLDGSAAQRLASVAVTRGMDQSELVAGRRCIVDTGDHNDPADFVVTAIYDSANGAYGNVVAQIPLRLTVPDISRWPLALRYDGTTDPAAAVWPAANRAIYTPFVVDQAVTVTDLYFEVVAAGAGNAEIGIYNAAGVKQGTSSGAISTAAAGIKTYTVTINLTRGRYYVGLASSGVVATFRRYAGAGAAANVLVMAGLKEQVASYPLPATATFANAAANYVPFGGLALA
jgi:hypothetical protein